jgi:hypothetical protein
MISHFVRRLLRDPILHFLALGALIFAGYQLMGSDSDADDLRIQISATDIAHLQETWRLQWGRNPTAAELRNLVDAYVREEILYREAMALGLDRDDVIVRRRLAQKMEFLTEDIATAGDPSAADLAAYFAENADQYREPPKVTVRHVFFSRERRRDAAKADAEAALRTLDGNPPPGLGDPFLGPARFSGRTEPELARQLGNDFAAAVFDLPEGRWSGPIQSVYGFHLVRVEDRRAGRQQTLADVRDRVLQDWRQSRRQAANDALYQDLRSKYKIEVDESALTASLEPAP